MNFEDIKIIFKEIYKKDMIVMKMSGVNLYLCPFCQEDGKKVFSEGKKGLVSHIMRHHLNKKIGFLDKNRINGVKTGDNK